jgi:hypothetical protein
VQPITAGSRQIRDKPGFIQTLAQVFTGFGFVFNDQYFHVPSPSIASH